MIDEPPLPHRITLLGQALRPCLLNLQSRIDAPVALDTHTPPTSDLIVSCK